MTDAINYKPSTAELGSLLRARLVDAYGNKLPDFTDDTTPTHAQAQEAINEAADEVSEEIGAAVSDARIGQAKRLVNLLAAANVELSYYPEQAAANNSMYDKLMQRYRELLPKLGEDTGEDAVLLDEVQSGGSFGGFPPAFNFGTRRW